MKKLWHEMSLFIKEKVLFNFVLLFENVVFGYSKYENCVIKEAFVINLLILLVKFHIHKCKFSNKKPLFSVFLKEFKNNFSTIQSSTNRKSMKTVHLCTVCKIFD